MLKNLWWLLPLIVLISFAASFITIWLLSRFSILAMNSETAAIIAMLTAAASGACLTAIFLLQTDKKASKD